MEDNFIEDQQPVSKPNVPIYSKMAVLGFCIFFNPVFGGVMLYSNLNDIGERKAGILALMISAILFMLSAYIGSAVFKGFAAIYVSNLVGGGLMLEYFYKKYFPNEDKMEKKSIQKPLLISLLISLVLVTLVLALGAKLPR